MPQKPKKIFKYQSREEMNKMSQFHLTTSLLPHPSFGFYFNWGTLNSRSLLKENRKVSLRPRFFTSRRLVAGTQHPSSMCTYTKPQPHQAIFLPKETKTFSELSNLGCLKDQDKKKNVWSGIEQWGELLHEKQEKITGGLDSFPHKSERCWSGHSL